MKFEVDLEVDDEQAEQITPEMMREHLQTYVFDTETSYELSKLPGDVMHELGGADDYLIFGFKSATVKVVE